MPYLFSEITTGLRRNLAMTFAVVVTVFISLTLFGAALLLDAQADTMKDTWYGKIEISIFMCNEFDTGVSCASGKVTEAQKATIEATLRASPEVEGVFYESQDAAYALFRDRFDDSIADNITPDQLQESFRIKLVNPEEYLGVVSAVDGLPGVAQVVDQRDLLDQVFRILHVLQLSALIVAGVQVLAALALIYNTIRIAAFSRRRETGIMRLVGASNWYIQLPFILEAAIAALIGAILACGAIVALKYFLVDQLLVPLLRFTAWVGWREVLPVIPILIGTGVGIAVLASFVTLRRYLRV